MTFFVFFSHLLSIFQIRASPRTKLHLSAKFQLQAFCSFSAIARRKLTLSLIHPIPQPVTRLAYFDAPTTSVTAEKFHS